MKRYRTTCYFLAALALNRNCLQTRMMTNRHRNRCLPTPVVFILIRALTSRCQHAVWCSRILNTNINVSPNRTPSGDFGASSSDVFVFAFVFLCVFVYFWSLRITSIWCQHWCCIGEGFPLYKEIVASGETPPVILLYPFLAHLSTVLLSHGNVSTESSF